MGGQSFFIMISLIFGIVLLCLARSEARTNKQYCDVSSDCPGLDLCCGGWCTAYEDCDSVDDFDGLFGLGLALTIIIPLAILFCCCCAGGTICWCVMRSRRSPGQVQQPVYIQQPGQMQQPGPVQEPGHEEDTGQIHKY